LGYQQKEEIAAEFVLRCPREKRMFRLPLIIGSIAALLITPVIAAEPIGIRLISGPVTGIPVHIVHIPLDGPRLEIRPALAAKGIGAAEPFEAFLKRFRPLAAINGTFFSKKTLLPIGDIVVDGKVLHRGRMGTAIAVRADGGVDFVRLPWGYNIDWKGYRHVLACGPTLVWEGQVLLSPRKERFRDPSIFAKKARSAIGVKADNTVIAVAVRRGISLEQLAEIMRRIGCRYAINLDGGGSVALAVGDRIIHRPSRRLTNVLLVVRRKGEGRQMLAMATPRGLDWQDTANAPLLYNRLSAQEYPLSSVVLRWPSGKVVIGPSQKDPTLLEVSGDRLPEGWRLELKSEKHLRGFLTSPCTIAMAKLMPQGGMMQVELVDAKGRRIDGGWVAITVTK